jgi:hypothetical protein
MQSALENKDFLVVSLVRQALDGRQLKTRN